MVCPTLNEDPAALLMNVDFPAPVTPRTAMSFAFDAIDAMTDR
jgi:hypothetical protein